MDRINKISGSGDEFTACLCSNEALVALYEILCKCQRWGIFTLGSEAPRLRSGSEGFFKQQLLKNSLEQTKKQTFEAKR